MAWMYYGNGLKLAQEMYDKAGYNVVDLPSAILVPETSGWFRSPIKSVGRPQGHEDALLRLGRPGHAETRHEHHSDALPASCSPHWRKRSLTPPSSPCLPSTASLGFYKLAKYNYFPGWHQQATIIDLLISKKNGKS
jgi:hypothetical protein